MLCLFPHTFARAANKDCFHFQLVCQLLSRSINELFGPQGPINININYSLTIELFSFIFYLVYKMSE